MSDNPPPPPPDGDPPAGDPGAPPPTQPEAYPPPTEPQPGYPPQSPGYPPTLSQPGFPAEPGYLGTPGPPAAPGVAGAYPPPGAYPPAGGPPPTQPGWGAGGGVPPGYGTPPPSGGGGGGAKVLLIVLGVVFGLAALVVIGAVALVFAGRSDNDAETVVRTTLPSATAPDAGPTTTDGAQPGDSALDPDATDTTTSGQEVSVFSVEVGECFNEPPGGNIDSIDAVDCDQPHDNEVFALFDMAGGNQAPFPGDGAVQAAAQDCIGSLFTDYVGIPYEQSRFGVFPITPTRETWEGGLHDREIVCTANTIDGTPLTSSVRGSNE